MNPVVTRFAPSPTGYLHIGGARTALFNWLFARHHGGKFLLRIEDTDRKRYSPEAVEAIYGGLKWLGLDWDEEPVSQFAGRARHQEVAENLLASGGAYRCYCSPEELTEMRERAREAGSARLYDGRWRDRDPVDAPAGVDPVFRLKAPQTGETVIEDAIQGTVRVGNDQLDDMILVRADGTPTYMLAVVVDDHDMAISHVIRGDDHLTNAFRQAQIYGALSWELPVFAHMPLLHGSDGKKLSKRHGALGVETYRDDGFLSDAMNNYLLRLGWSHGSDEIISRDEAIEWFDLDAVGRGAAQFDMDKLTSLNGHYIRHAGDAELLELVRPILEKLLGHGIEIDALARLKSGLSGLKERAKNINELSENALFYVHKRPLPVDDKARKLLDEQGRRMVDIARDELAGISNWSHDELENSIRDAAAARDENLGKLAQPLRAALTGSNVSPGIFEVMEILGREETLGRLEDAVSAP
ncbi:MAG: glutamate--tRNA ligase [Rhodospirillaceae bacterium]|nr:glutamate--tRNA ligase [Rhodospirillaceae bacterium]